MVSICGQDSNSVLNSDDLASSDVLVKLSQYTSVEMSNFTVFVIVFLSYYLHFQSLKSHVSEILGPTTVNNVISNIPDKKSHYRFALKLLVPITLAVVLGIGVIVPTWTLLQPQLGYEEMLALVCVIFVVSLFLSKLLMSVKTPGLKWIILVLMSLAISVYAVVKTSTCNPDRVCLYKPEGESDNFLDFDWIWIGIALSIFVVHKICMLVLSFKFEEYNTPLSRVFSLIMFSLFYAFMIFTTFLSSPETKHHQYTPCTSKGSFVGQLIYWPLFLIIVFYTERGAYDIGRSPLWKLLLLVFSTLLFVVPIATIYHFQRDPATAISRRTCTLQRPTITLDTPQSRCCTVQKLSQTPRIFDVHLDNLNLNVSDITFTLFEENDDRSLGSPIIIDDNPDIIELQKGPKPEKGLSDNQIEMKAGTGFIGDKANYVLQLTVNNSDSLQFYQNFTSTSFRQRFEFVKTNQNIEEDEKDDIDIVGCTGKNTPVNIKLNGRGGPSNPIVFKGKHENIGATRGALWGFTFSASFFSLILAFYNASRPRLAGRSKAMGAFIGIVYATIFYGGFGAAAGAAAGAINESRLKQKRLIDIDFKYIDQYGYPVARVQADDDDKDVGVPVGTPTFSNSALELDKLDIDYTPPSHCNYMANYKIDFSEYNNIGDKSYKLEIDYGQGSTINNKTIYFKQEQAADPIFGSDSGLYWGLYLVFLFTFNFLWLIIQYYFSDGDTTILKGVTEGITTKMTSQEAVREPSNPSEAVPATNIDKAEARLSRLASSATKALERFPDPAKIIAKQAKGKRNDLAGWAEDKRTDLAGWAERKRTDLAGWAEGKRTDLARGLPKLPKFKSKSLTSIVPTG